MQLFNTEAEAAISTHHDRGRRPNRRGKPSLDHINGVVWSVGQFLTVPPLARTRTVLFAKIPLRGPFRSGDCMSCDGEELRVQLSRVGASTLSDESKLSAFSGPMKFVPLRALTIDAIADLSIGVQ